MIDKDLKKHFLKATGSLDVEFKGRPLASVKENIRELTLYVTYSGRYVLHILIARPLGPTESIVYEYHSLDNFYENIIIDKLTKELLEKAGLKTSRFIP